MNKVILACTGSRKTTQLVETALSNDKIRILIVTYTINNYNEIRKQIENRIGFIPKNIIVKTWFSFLLSDGVRPYQSSLYTKKRIKSIYFVPGNSAKWKSKTDIQKYYLYGEELIYTDKISDFVCRVNHDSSGKVINRLEKIYDEIYIDEIQDLAGYDFCFLELLFNSKINMYVVGDCRQATYYTNQSLKNKKFRGYKILNLFSEWQKRGTCQIEFRNDNYRCNQFICDFSDLLYPELPTTTSYVNINTGHDGIFIVKTSDVHKYIQLWQPQILKYDKKTKTMGYNSLNFGESKGLSFDRVLIFPNNSISKYLLGREELKPQTKSKFYVGITRARYSVAFVYDKQPCNPSLMKMMNEWK